MARRNLAAPNRKHSLNYIENPKKWGILLFINNVFKVRKKTDPATTGSMAIARVSHSSFTISKVLQPNNP